MSSKADSRTVYQCQETINKIMSANSITRKGEVLKMLLKVSDLSETKSTFSLNLKITPEYLRWMKKYKSWMQPEKVELITWVAIIT